MGPVLKFSEARNDMSRVVDRVQAGEPAVVERRGFRFIITSFEEQRQLLDGCFAFNPEVLFEEEGGIAIWLPELAIYGEGETLEEAEEDLVDEALVYVDHWRDHLRNAANHVQRRGWVFRLEMADDRVALHRILFGE